MMSPISSYQELFSKIAQTYHLWALYVFGSRAGEVVDMLEGRKDIDRTSASDIDIGVHYDESYEPNLKEKVLLTQELEQLFDVPRVDLVDVGRADPFLAVDIIRGELVFCSRPDDQAEFELYVLRRAGDLAYFERRRRAMILNG